MGRRTLTQLVELNIPPSKHVSLTSITNDGARFHFKPGTGLTIGPVVYQGELLYYALNTDINLFVMSLSQDKAMNTWLHALSVINTLALETPYLEDSSKIIDLVTIVYDLSNNMGEVANGNTSNIRSSS